MSVTNRIPGIVVMAGMVLLAPIPAMAEIGPDDDVIIPGERVGIITKNTTEAELKAALKSNEYKRDLISIGEGYCRHGSIIYPGTPKEIGLTWKSANEDVECVSESASLSTLQDEDPYTVPNYAKVAGVNWHTKEGLKPGLTIAELQKINGRPFVFTGFDWDYGGRVTSWEKGAIPQTIMVELGYNEVSTADQKHVPQGDGFIKSDKMGLPAKIKVETILVSFP